MDSGFESTLTFLLKEVSGEDSAMLAAALETEFQRGAEGGQPGFQMLDPSISGDGGTAFLWEDALALGDIVDATTPLMSLYSPNEIAAIVKVLLTAWTRLRRVRVALDQSEMRVMRAIKRGHGNVLAIAKYTGLSEQQVKETLVQLRAKRYKEDVELIEGDEDHLSTKF